MSPATPRPTPIRSAPPSPTPTSRTSRTSATCSRRSRAGKLNHETGFVLERFGVPPSAEIDSLVATVNDLDLKKPIAVHVQDSIQALARHDARPERAVRAGRGRLGQAGGRGGAQGHRPPLHGQRRVSQIFRRRRSSSTSSSRPWMRRVISNAKQLTVLTGRVLIAAMQRGTTAEPAAAGRRRGRRRPERRPARADPHRAAPP